jgi:hypothetical protein
LFSERSSDVFEPTPIYKLLMYADHQRQIPYDQLLRWAAEFGVRIPDIFDPKETKAYDDVPAYAPSPRRRLPLVFLFELVALAYAEGWIGLDRVLAWAEERELEEDQVMTLLERCASEGHSFEPTAA